MRCGDPRWKDQNFGFLEMSNFDKYVVESAFGSILVDPKFGSFHVGSPHLMAVTGQSWLTLVGNSNNEVCSPSNNTVSKAFWQKKVLPEQRISYCEGIYISATDRLWAYLPVGFIATNEVGSDKKPLAPEPESNFECSFVWFLWRKMVISWISRCLNLKLIVTDVDRITVLIHTLTYETHAEYHDNRKWR